ncbi:YbaB/EbfC family nucleoid-associated protein [Micromonospora chalcea]|uniref:YbaB/EbfC family nucleoid-associated protein n=1 Tax=Micromonospora chalcea TaxID=1874 RepID=UPI0033221394
MTQDAAADDYALRVSGYREEVAALRAGAHPAGGGTADGHTAGGVIAEARGRAADGQVEVTAEDGRLRAVELAAPLMRLSEDELGDLVEQAVNDALTASRRSLASSEPVADLSALTGSLGAVLAESKAAMRRLHGAIADAVATAGPATGLGGDVPANVPADLLHQVMDVLGTATGGTPADDGGDERWSGSDDAGTMRAEVDGSARLTRLEVTRPPRRLSSAELGESVVVAVNRALEQIPPAAAPQGLGSAALDARLRELQEASVRQMSALTGALTGVMQTIRDPGR